MRVVVLYQNFIGGVKTATESVISEMPPSVLLNRYCQKRPRFHGLFIYTRTLIWSIIDFCRYLNTQSDLDWVWATSFVSVIAARLSKQKKVKILFYFHGSQSFSDQHTGTKGIRRWYTLLLGRCVEYLQKCAFWTADHICFVSPQEKGIFYKKYTWLAGVHKSTVVLNGVNSQEFFPVSHKEKNILRKKHGFFKKDHIILYVGRIDETKGISALLEGVRCYKDTYKKLIIISPSPTDSHSFSYLRKINSTISEHGDTFISFINNPKNINEYYQLADCVILPSYKESFSLVLLESIACGTVFLGSPTGYIGSVLNIIEPLCILRSKTPMYIQKKLVWFFSLHAQKRQRVQKKCVLESKKFTWGRTSKKLLSIFIV